MPAALLVKFQPAGPWRIGTDSGAREETDRLLHSDTLFAALTRSMEQLDLLDPWLDATARATRPRMAISSLFPFQEQTLYAIPPATVWPPVETAKTYWKGARFAPLSVIRPLLDHEALEEDRWIVDVSSECLIASGRYGRTGGPTLIRTRSSAAVDRMTGVQGELRELACLEFRENSGFWCVLTFADDATRSEWSKLMRGAFQHLADSGIGGERARGWGRTRALEFREGDLADMLLPARRKPANPEVAATSDETPAEPALQGHWLLSLYAPSSIDSVDWNQGHYALLTRSGRTNGGALNKRVRLVQEGSVLITPDAPVGAAKDVAPEGHPHPVYRSGLAVSIPIPVRSRA